MLLEEKIKMWKVNGRRMPSNGKSSRCLWQGELKNLETYLFYNNCEFMNFKGTLQLRCPIIILYVNSLTVSKLRLFQCLLLPIHWYDNIWVILLQHLRLFTFCTWTQVLWKGSSSCSTCDTLVTNLAICHEWEKDCIVIRQMEHIHGHLWHRYTALSQ